MPSESKGLPSEPSAPLGLLPVFPLLVLPSRPGMPSVRGAYAQWHTGATKGRLRIALVTLGVTSPFIRHVTITPSEHKANALRSHSEGQRTAGEGRILGRIVTPEYTHRTGSTLAARGQLCSVLFPHGRAETDLETPGMFPSGNIFIPQACLADKRHRTVTSRAVPDIKPCSTI